MGDHHRGIGMPRRAVELDPSNAQARAALGAALLQIGEAEGIEHMRQGIRISPRDNRLAAWGALMARGLLSFGRVTESIAAAESACRSDDKIFLPRVVLGIACAPLVSCCPRGQGLGEPWRPAPRNIAMLKRFSADPRITRPLEVAPGDASAKRRML